MRKLFLLGVSCLLAGCVEEAQLAPKAGLCRVRLSASSPEWAEQDGRSPQLISTFSLSGLRGAQNLYQLFWLQPSGLFRELRNETGTRAGQQLLLAPDVSVFHVTNHQEKALIAYSQQQQGKDRLFITFGNTEEDFLHKLQSPEQRKVESIAIAAQGLTAAVFYTAQTPEGLQAYLQTIDLCPFYDDDEIQQRCYTAAASPGQEHIWETPEKSAPLLIGKANALTRGAISIAPINEGSFILSLEDASGQKRLYQLYRKEEGQDFQAEEGHLLPPIKTATSGAMPLVRIKASGDVYAFYSEETSQLLFSPLDGTYARYQAPLSGKGALRSYAAALAYRDPNDTSKDELAALWFGAGPLNRGNKQLSFARLSRSGALQEAPLRVLPGEEISIASMAALDHESNLQFGVFYQHEDSEVGLGFVQIACDPH